MTSLKELLESASNSEDGCRKQADAYVRELEEHMKNKEFKERLRKLGEQHMHGWMIAVDEMLRFLREETK